MGERDPTGISWAEFVSEAILPIIGLTGGLKLVNAVVAYGDVTGDILHITSQRGDANGDTLCLVLGSIELRESGDREYGIEHAGSDLSS